MVDSAFTMILQAVVLPLVVALIYFRIKTLLLKAKEGWKKYEALKEKNIAEWRETYTKNQCDIKKSLLTVEKNLYDKVPFVYCRDREKELQDGMEKLDVRVREIERGVRFHG